MENHNMPSAPQAANSKVAVSTIIAVLSLSLVVNLPGLAITPMLSTLSSIFPHTSETEKQLLTVMPNLLIIPFVLLSGKLSTTTHRKAVIITGLAMFMASAVAYLFARSMGQLIVISCVLGCAAGLIIPFAAGLIADYFQGAERMKMMGVKSGIANMSLVVATFAVGWLSAAGWRLPFLVYSVCLIPLAMSWGLRGSKQIVAAATQESEANADEAPVPNTRNGYNIGRIAQTVGVYIFLTFAVLVISYYSPFLISSQGLPDWLTGTITSVFYLAVFLPGFLLPRIVKLLKADTFFISGALILAGLCIFSFMRVPALLCLGAALAGAGYGICQPLIYDKGSQCASPRKVTMALAIVLAGNYIAVTIAPFVIDLFRVIFGFQSSELFPFILSGALTVIYLVIVWYRRKAFVFSISEEYYK